MPLLKRFAHDARTAETRRTLTLREMQILECLAEGESNKSIGRRFSVGEETIKTHLAICTRSSERPIARTQSPSPCASV